MSAVVRDSLAPSRDIAYMAVSFSSRADVRKRRGHGTPSAVSALPCAHPTRRTPEAAMRSFEPGSRRRLHARNLKRRHGGVAEQQCLGFFPARNVDALPSSVAYLVDAPHFQRGLVASRKDDNDVKKRVRDLLGTRGTKASQMEREEKKKGRSLNHHSKEERSHASALPACIPCQPKNNNGERFMVVRGTAFTEHVSLRLPRPSPPGALLVVSTRVFSAKF